MNPPSRKQVENSLLSRADLEMLNGVELWADLAFSRVVKIRDLYNSDQRPKAESQVLHDLLKSVKNVKDFYTLPS